ncbi:MAG: hypothetical protein U9R56_03505 [candidate division Zixibacteria bacterium]|nr:hypothetical protein [candidate division Zixibacteria bacterium]
MFEYLIIIMIVAAACWFVVRNLWRQIKNCHCDDCYYAKRGKGTGKLIQLGTLSRRKLLPGHRVPMIHDN